MKTIQSVFICALCLIASGCMPFRFQTPQVTGKVYDAASGQPIAGAKAFWVSWPDEKAESRKDGTYLLSSQKRTRLVFPLGDHLPSKAAGDFRIEATGYESQQKKTAEGLGDFRMAPVILK